MKKFLAIVLTLALCLGLCSMAAAETTTYKIGILAPAVTHGWVAGVAYHAEQRCKELADTVEYKLYTSNNAEEMTTQLDDLKTWGAQAIVAFPQWEGMEVPIQEAIDEGIVVVNFDIEIAADGVYRVSGDNESMGVEGAKYIVDKIGTASVMVNHHNTACALQKLRRLKQTFHMRIGNDYKRFFGQNFRRVSLVYNKIVVFAVKQIYKIFNRLIVALHKKFYFFFVYLTRILLRIFVHFV